MKKILILLFCFIIFLDAAAKPKLVVFLVVDQTQPQLLHKYDTLFSGGFRWLKDNGIEYSRVYHEHGYTATAPGHFTLSTGQYPGRGGVIGNWWYDRSIGKSWYCVEDSTARILSDGSPGRSYRFCEHARPGRLAQAGQPGIKSIFYFRQGSWCRVFRGKKL